MDARSWTQSHPPVLSSPDAFLHLRLRVDDAWLLDTGEWRPIADETSAALWTILGFLRWHAPVLMSGDPDASRFTSVDAYLASRPLVVAVDADLARRGEIEAGMALTYLRAMGPAPWEVPAHYLASRRRSAR